MQSEPLSEPSNRFELESFSDVAQATNPHEISIVIYCFNNNFLFIIYSLIAVIESLIRVRHRHRHAVETGLSLRRFRSFLGRIKPLLAYGDAAFGIPDPFTPGAHIHARLRKAGQARREHQMAGSDT